MAYSLELSSQMKSSNMHKEIAIMIRKLSLLVLLLTSIGFFSCSDDTILNSPETPQNNTSLSKEGSVLNKDNNLTTFKSKGNYGKRTTTTKTIDGEKGGVITLSGVHVALGRDLNTVIMNTKLTIPKGAFKGIREITLTADYESPGIICDPHMVFDKPLLLDLKYVGLSLKKLNLTPSNVKFGYIRYDGTVEPCENDGIDFDPLNGLLGVHQAQIHHFSRYAFSR